MMKFRNSQVAIEFREIAGSDKARAQIKEKERVSQVAIKMGIVINVRVLQVS